MIEETVAEKNKIMETKHVHVSNVGSGMLCG